MKSFEVSKNSVTKGRSWGLELLRRLPLKCSKKLSGATQFTK